MPRPRTPPGEARGPSNDAGLADGATRKIGAEAATAPDRRVRRRITTLVACAGVAASVAACGSSPALTPITAQTTGSTTATQTAAGTSTTTGTTGTSGTSTTATTGVGPQGIPLETGPLLAPGTTPSQGTTVDGIQCVPLEQLAYRTHAHLQVYVDGVARMLPADVGLVGPVAQQTPAGPLYGAQTCYYWLHTHATDGVIDIESPTPRIYTLGNFFDVWGQPLSSRQVAGAHGTVHATVDGRPWRRSPRAIPLRTHEVIQLAVGRPVPRFHRIDWSTSQL